MALTTSFCVLNAAPVPRIQTRSKKKKVGKQSSRIVFVFFHHYARWGNEAVSSHTLLPSLPRGLRCHGGTWWWELLPNKIRILLLTCVVQEAGILETKEENSAKLFLALGNHVSSFVPDIKL